MIFLLGASLSLGSEDSGVGGGVDVVEGISLFPGLAFFRLLRGRVLGLEALKMRSCWSR